MSSDSFLEIPIRFLGYGYGYNEATRFLYNHERLLYTMTNLYVLAHVLVKAIDASDARAGAFDCIDILIFHLLASVGIPYLIAQVSRSLIDELISNINTNQNLRRWGPVILVVAILIIVSIPLDKAVNKALDATLRKVLKKAR